MVRFRRVSEGDLALGSLSRKSFAENGLSSDYEVKRRILEIVFLNCDLVDTTLVATIRKPFDALAEGLISKDSRGDRTAIELFAHGVRAWPRVLVLAVEPLMANSAT